MFNCQKKPENNMQMNTSKPPKDFAVFILTHGRPDNVITLNTLKKCGYTGDVYIIIDNEDKTAKKYYEKFGDQVVMFDKKEIADKTDEGDNFNDRRTTTHVRNSMFEIARDLGLRYFIQLDDDYVAFSHSLDHNGNYNTKHPYIKDLNKTFSLFLDFYINANISSVCFAQGGDFIAGENSSVFKKGLSRKAMNSFICSTDREFKFVGRLNEDVNTYVSLGNIGVLFLTFAGFRLEQKQTQSSTGGMTETYLDSGTYVKSFYTVMFSPSCTKVSLMGNTNRRLHHLIKWKNAVPVILNEKYRKN